MYKEILTREIIAKEVKRLCIKKILEMVLPMILMFCFLSAILSQLNRLNYNISVTSVIMLIFFAVCFIFTVTISCYIIFSNIYYYIKIKCNKFTIISDTVYQKNAKKTYYIGRGIFGTIPFSITFSRFSKYYIPYGKNYKSSEFFTTTDKRIYENTSIGDTFYLILINNKKILLAYPNSLFEYKDII